MFVCLVLRKRELAHVTVLGLVELKNRFLVSLLLR